MGEAADIGRLGLEDMEGDPLRALGPDAGQPAQFVDEVLNDAFVQRTAFPCCGEYVPAAGTGPGTYASWCREVLEGQAWHTAETLGERTELLLLELLRVLVRRVDGGDDEIREGLPSSCKEDADSGSTAFGSITRPRSSPEPLTVALTRPPPDWPSTSVAASSSCARARSCCIFWACWSSSCILG